MASLIVIAFSSQAKASRIFARYQEVARCYASCSFHVVSSLLLTSTQCLAAIVASIPEHTLNFKAADQASLHAAFCVALQVTSSPLLQWI
jgi:hypothetical protein